MKFDNLVETLCHEARVHGLRVKRANGSTEISQEERLLLEQHARSLLARWPGTPFDPALNAHDKLAADAADARLRECHNVKWRCMRGEAKVLLLKEALASHHVPDEPQPIPVLKWAGVALLSAGLWFGLFDWMHAHLQDRFVAVVAALAPATAFGLFVAVSLLNSRSTKNRPWALTVGISISAGLMRYAFSGGSIMAIVVAVLDSIIVGVLYHEGQSLREAYANWEVARGKHIRLQNRLNAAVEVANRAAEHHQALERANEAHRDMIESRSLWFQKREEIEAAVIIAEIKGAWDAVAEHEGLLCGIIPEYIQKEIAGI